MAVIVRHRNPLYLTRRYQKVSLLFVAAFLFFLWNHLPEPPETANNTGMDRPPPQYIIEEKPEFLYRSPFREHPDHEYETMIDRSLKKIEEKTLAEDNGNIEAKETIWQIMLDTDRKSVDRGPDSIAFEHANQGWEYKECFPSFMLLSNNSNVLTVDNEQVGHVIYQRHTQRGARSRPGLQLLPARRSPC